MAMSFGALSIVAAITIGTLMISEASPPETSCRNVLTDFNRVQFKEISLCSKSLKYSSAKDKQQKSACIMKCVLQNMGLINPAGALSMEQYDHYLKEQFPVSLQNRANSTFSPCLKLLGGFKTTSNTVVQEDSLCKAYAPFVKCISISSMRLCSGLI